ncbi:MAG TPA: polysaccharide deacetylase family protein [Draconibacterium sp.]|nr:polysaccharide deacetylase family protein [Draconibacterium sp.]
MNEFPRFVSSQLGRLIPIRTLLKVKIPVFQPFYHVVSNENLPHIVNYNYRNTVQFEKELDFYLKYFKPVSLSELMTGKSFSKNIFHLSFDDGLKECAEIIAPILLKKGIPATFFVNPGFVDNQQLFHKYKASLILGQLKKVPHSEAEKILKDQNLQGEQILKATILQEVFLDEVAELTGINFENFLAETKPYLSTEQLLKLKEQGFSIGAHSYSHPEFWKISEDEQMNEIKKSMHWLVEKINPEIKAFSFPFTDSGVSQKVMKALKNQNICDISFGTAGIKYDEYDSHLQRYPVEMPGDFKQNLKAELVYFVLRKIIGKATVKH